MTKQRAFEIAVAAYRACAAKGCPDCQKDMAAFDAAQKAADEPTPDLPDQPINLGAPPADGPHVVDGTNRDVWWCRTHERQLSECMKAVDPPQVQFVRPSPWIPTRK